jgi:transcriptional regulator with XRE-family HTH domain
MSFASNLQFHRMKSGMNQNQLAEAVGITASQISRYENGLAHPRVAIAHKISEALGVPFELLTARIDLGGKPKNRKNTGRTRLEVKVKNDGDVSTHLSLMDEAGLSQAIQGFLDDYVQEVLEDEPHLQEAIRTYRLAEVKLLFVGNPEDGSDN